ncbi:MAG TPA: hypothetical protein PKW37_01935 [Salinivirgaceae bacterium]|nr:hypothetical protein [Salinivirgaceae bacterium]
MKKFNFILGVALTATIGFVGCAPKAYVTQYAQTSQAQLAKNVEASQTKGNITIELTPLSDKEYEKTFYKQKIDVLYTPLLSTEVKQKTEEYLFQVYSDLTPFQVTVINNTPHILRMGASRVIFVDPDSDEPVFALDKLGILQDIKGTFPAYEALINRVKKEYPLTSAEMIEADVTKGFTEVINKLKFINGFNMEIMPSMRATGTLIFPVKPEKAADGLISFVDMVSKTDPAGNPTERVRFDYKTEILNRYWKVDPNANQWVEIQKDEYNKGKQNPQRYIYNKQTKKWEPQN